MYIVFIIFKFGYSLTGFTFVDINVFQAFYTNTKLRVVIVIGFRRSKL
jgi:hypothetical protein